METCPLCLDSAHSGKCGRRPKGKWWCGLCLVQHVESDGPPLPPTVLASAGVRRTSRWCHRCATPICDAHRQVHSTYARATPRCLPDPLHPDCRARPAVVAEALKRRLEVYVPDFLTAGPIRCLVCNKPAFRRSLCQRHYEYVRSGRKSLPVEYLRVPIGEARVLRGVSLPKSISDAIQRASEQQGISFSRCAAEALEGVFGDPKNPVFNPVIIGKHEEAERARRKLKNSKRSREVRSRAGKARATPL